MHEGIEILGIHRRVFGARTMADLTGTAYGGFWIRVLAYLVDTVVLFIGFVVLGAACAFLGPAGAPILGAAGVIGPILYWGLMQASARQATFGKSLLGMKVTDTDGNRLSIPRSLVREVAKILSGFLLLIGFLMAAFTGRKQALHDMIASTVVVRESPGHVIAGLAIGLLGWIAPVALVMALGVGLFAGLMGGMMKDMQGTMVEEMKKGPPMQQTVKFTPAPVVRPPSAPVQVAAAPAQTAAAAPAAAAPKPVAAVAVAPVPVIPPPAAQAEKAPARAPMMQASAAAPRNRTRANEDARNCLDLATQVAIIRCAEKYR